MQALTATCHRVYAVKEPYATSGAKSEKGDAHALAGMVRIDGAQLRPVAGDSEQAQASAWWPALTRPAPSSGCGARFANASPAG